jgi:predicted 3-demethylubiquinone-9 3-methyltransferase (glyoxalase superfamily)
MSKVSIYPNFQGNTEDALNFYKSVFNTDFVVPIYGPSTIPKLRPITSESGLSLKEN